MPRIAVLADIHSNMPALTAVSRHLEQQQVDEIIVAGDLVGRGPQGSAVTHFIMEKGWPCIRGNHEDYVLNFAKGEYPEEWATAEEWSAARWMGAELDRRAATFLDALPLTMTSHLASHMRIVHGTPESYKKGLGTWTPPDKLQAAFDQVDEPLLVCAHTHRPFRHDLDMGLIVNVGSVGMPFNADTRAQYAIFTTPEGEGQWDVSFQQVEYDRDDIYQIYESTGFLQQGGITAFLLLTELQRARPFLVPFFKWVELTENHPNFDNVHQFLDLYDPENPYALFPKNDHSKPARWEKESSSASTE